MGKESDNECIVPMRLQKFLARAGVASRRGSENLMTAGRVTVNGAVVTELGSKVDPRIDEVAVDGKPVHLADGPVTLMLHKPVGYVTTMSDPQGRPTVAELVPADECPGLFPVGRLDRDTTGLLLFSTDGELGHGLLRPKGHVTKRYVALVEGRPSKRDLEQLRQGIELDDGPALPAEAQLVEGHEADRLLKVLDASPALPHSPSRQYAAMRAHKQYSVVRIELHEGRKRQVRRMLGAVGCPVVALHREAFGPLQLGALARGSWRELTQDEVAALHCAVRKQD
ncbi:pseudouridine synthase [Eggerthella sp. YY7918]|uniref:pseudouridine synthase n=1 Tax=Eggerthella sp. (strain YY7918) TaxID=502558 RepID=UPI00021714E8|nr:16S rRNA uridine 516 pseudouridylate synthase [Eggerthella sp. YY7918]